MATLFGHVPVEEVGNGSFTRIDIICGLRIISDSVDRTNRKYGSHTIGESYSMPWSYPDQDLDDLGGPTSIIFTLLPLLPAESAAPLQLSTTLEVSNANGNDAIDQINTALQNMLSGVQLNVDTGGLRSDRIRLISLTGDEPFTNEPIVVELMGQSAAELAGDFPDLAIEDVTLGAALAALDYTASSPRPRTIYMPRTSLDDAIRPWLRLSGIAKTGDQPLSISLPGINNQALFPTIFLSPWEINTTKPGPVDAQISSTLAVSRFNQRLTAAELDLDDSDIPTGWILVHGIDFDFRDGFLEITADLAHTTPLADRFKLGSFGELRGEIRLKPTTFRNRPFSEGTFNNLFEVDVELEWDDDPDSDLEDFHPVDPWFEDIVSGIIQQTLVEEIDSQIGTLIRPRIVNTITTELDSRRPNGLFSDDGWAEFREQIIAKFFLRFTRAEFFGTRTINGVSVIGGLEFDALAGSFDNNLALLDLDTGASCPAVEAAGAVGGFSSFYTLARFRTIVRSDTRCSGWNELYLRNRKELVSLVRRHPKLAKSLLRTAWAVSPMLGHNKRVFDQKTAQTTLELLGELSEHSGETLRNDFKRFGEWVSQSVGANFEQMLGRAAAAVKPIAKIEPQIDASDAPRIHKKRRSSATRKEKHAD